MPATPPLTAPRSGLATNQTPTQYAARMDRSELLALAEAWLAEDPDPDTWAELQQVIASGDIADLADRFDGRLEFGTAGLRGAIGAGSNRMNRVVVIRAAAGLAAYLNSHGGGSVVVGYDARYKSQQFAADTADVMRGAGLPVFVLPRQLPTPVLAYAIRHLGCAAGVMVTASHNPPQDNGYKVYLGDGSQIVPPADTEISAAIDAVGRLADIPRSDHWKPLDDTIVDAYLDAVAALPGVGPKELTMVYTPLHGVGGEMVLDALSRAGFAPPITVPEQEEPDPAFPTVGFPNPEEPGAMDLALALAEQEDADIVLANDPDADRCAAAVPGPHRWRMLRGDEVGGLLADQLLRRGLRGVYATSIVSSSLLSRMAAHHEVPYAETLTGFKWLGKIDGLTFGYEEALGYCVAPSLVRDKDGISALLMLAELTAELRAEGLTLQDRLDEIARTYGLHATDQLSVRVKSPNEIDDAMARLRAQPPDSLGGFDVLQIDDLAAGSQSLPPTDGLRFGLTDRGRVIVRPSGTEPKVKCYLEVVVPVSEGDVDASRIVAAGRLDAMRNDIARAAGLPVN
jgi:phosphomannomutase